MFTVLCVRVCVFILICVCVRQGEREGWLCVCVCVCARRGEREGWLCVCVRVCEMGSGGSVCLCVCVNETEGGRKGNRREYVCVQAQNCICMGEHGIMQAVFCYFLNFYQAKKVCTGFVYYI